MGTVHVELPRARSISVRKMKTLRGLASHPCIPGTGPGFRIQRKNKEERDRRKSSAKATVLAFDGGPHQAEFTPEFHGGVPPAAPETLGPQAPFTTSASLESHLPSS